MIEYAYAISRARGSDFKQPCAGYSCYNGEKTDGDPHGIQWIVGTDHPGWVLFDKNNKFIGYTKDFQIVENTD